MSSSDEQPNSERRNSTSPDVVDPHRWLEDVEGAASLAWVRERNSECLTELERDPGFVPLRDRLRRSFDAKDRIPFVGARREWLYNHWTDEQNPRGLWRRTTRGEYEKEAPQWEILLDLDALGEAEGESWVWRGAELLRPDYERALVTLSRGGADAHVVREFDILSKQFVPDGFSLPEAKSYVCWQDFETIYVGTDFGPGTLTDTGLPRIAKEWKRGTPLADASLVFEGNSTDLSVYAGYQVDHGRSHHWVVRIPSFFGNETFLRSGSTLQRIDKPDDATASTWDDQLIIKLRSEWTVAGTTWPAGAVLILPLMDFLDGGRGFTMLFEPKPYTSLDGISSMDTGFIVVELEDVKHRVYEHRRTANGWVRRPVPSADIGSAHAWGYDEGTDDYWFLETGFTTPTTLYLGRLGSDERQLMKRNPEHFDAAGLEVTQHFAISHDGTRVPYFQVAREGLVLDRSHPTIVNGYGGFELSLTPSYSATSGAAWLERGGVMVIANTRGGGEYGPAWHRAAQRQHRQRAFDDFAAVAEDLIRRGVTQPAKLGAIGGSNGGLLMGVMLTQRPDLFGAIVCQAPLLDMRRYHRLFAGPAWLEEYGDPDNPEDWAVIANYSPYHNLRAQARYPRTLITASTMDDRVHPGHARKMVARMRELGHDVLYYENVEGGHGGAADNEQQALLQALAYTFFARELGLRSAAPEE